MAVQVIYISGNHVVHMQMLHLKFFKLFLFNYFLKFLLKRRLQFFSKCKFELGIAFCFLLKDSLLCFFRIVTAYTHLFIVPLFILVFSFFVYHLVDVFDNLFGL